MKTTALMIMLIACNIVNAQIQKLQPTQVSIFKNGSYFITKQGEVKVENSKVLIDAPKNVLMGGFWLNVANNASLQAITIKVDTIITNKTAKNIDDYYKALIGKEISIQEGYYPNYTTLTGQLLDYDIKNNIIKLKTANGKIVIKKIENDNRLEFKATENLAFTDYDLEDIAEIKLNEKVNTTTVNTISLHEGIQWIPSYLLKIKNNNEATLTLKAAIINGKEHFKNTNIDVVIGNPEMFYGNTPDPLAFNYFSSISSANNATQGYNLNTTFFSNGTYKTDDNDSHEVEEPEFDEKAGNKSEDLYFFQLMQIELAPNSRVIVPIKTINLTYEDVYTCNLPVNSAVNKLEVIPEVVNKYSILNKSNIPLTTGSVLVLNKEEQLIAQSELKYTTVGGKQGIKLSNAIDVSVNNDETETKRVAQAKKLKNGTQYDLITYAGKISIRNSQNKKIKLVLTKNLYGTVETISNNGEAIKKKGNLVKENSISELNWEIELSPNENIDLTYTYNSYE